MNLVKSTNFTPDPNDLENGSFYGYASTIGNVDSDGDVFAKGAWRKSIGEFLQRGMILWQHDTSSPIGKPVSVEEDEKGLAIKAKISDTAQGRDAITLLRDGVVSSMSVGFKLLGFEMLSDQQARKLLGDSYESTMKSLPPWVSGIRRITEAKLFEVSLVSFPANDRAIVQGIKSTGRLPGSEREFEAFLRDAGWSRSAAVAITSHGWKSAGLRDAVSEEDEELVAELAKFAATLSHGADECRK